MLRKWDVGIFMFDEVEVLDFAGPFEVFSVTAYSQEGTVEEKPFSVKTVSETGQMVTARNGLKVQPDYSFATAPPFDILIIPGGPGARQREIYNENAIRWIQSRMPEVQFMTSVCTGALLLAKAGILDGKAATTHWASYDRLEQEFPQVTVKQNVKFVDEGNIVTSGGISAGIYMSFHLVAKLLGWETAMNTAKRMEFDLDRSHFPANG
ncbi:DJ-1/PfpI family protein [Brevibacillus fulvus]|uniref:Transcriptional regulator GlxA family with amidase domain n=1 Tax=Brevibacillus fulvus TaxID=1125967 RepID=A0A938Y2Z9_9BACL|nr:DJ-1/PfpI family protein [Brevibacillus fulvus]MBM7591419.1 transcriptional regulator GlxA family with amidase domain [Brevibacillus fulvus]